MSMYMCIYLIATFVNAGYKDELGYEEVDTQVDVDVVTHAPQ